MTWGVIKVEEQKKLFISAYLDKKFNISDLCKQFDISRPCGYKLINKFEEVGWGVKESSREPRSSPKRTSPSIEEEILNVKYTWPEWGPKKVLAALKREYPEIKWPCQTTVENILKRNGLIEQRKLRKRLAKRTDPLGECNSSNDIWCIDFKGCG